MVSRRIYYVSYETGFLSIHSYEIIQNLIKSGATVDLFMATDVEPHFNMQSDCNVHRVPAIFGNFLMNFAVLQILLCLYILALIIRTGKPDMIYARQSFSGFPVIVMARLLKITYFAEANGITAGKNSSFVSLKNRVKISLEYFCLKLADVIIVPSET